MVKAKLKVNTGKKITGVKNPLVIVDDKRMFPGLIAEVHKLNVFAKQPDAI